MDLDQYNQPELSPEPGDQGATQAPVGPSTPQTEAQSQAPPVAPPDPGRRPRGKIARLAPTLREQINQMLDEGISYANIIARLGPDGASLNEVNISRWYQTGHQEWLKHQEWLDETRTRLDFAINVVDEHKSSNVHQANLHVAATQLIDNLIKCGEALLDKAPEHYVSLANSISRLSREALNFQKYREACLLAHAEVTKLRDPNRKLNEQETLAIVDRLDEILGFK